MKILECIDSTQNYIKSHDCDVVVAKKQTSGYGVSGDWDSSCENLYFSKRCEYSTNLWLVAIVSIYQVCREYTEDVYIKIPNDLYIKNKKISGFLIEYSKEAYLGIGLNIFEPLCENRIGLGFYDKNISISDLSVKLDEIIERNLLISYDDLYSSFKGATTIIGTDIEFIYKKTTLRKKVVDLKDNIIYFEDFSCYFDQIKLVKWNVL